MSIRSFLYVIMFWTVAMSQGSFSAFGCCKEPVVGIFAHGLGDCGRQAKFYNKMMDIDLEYFDFLDAQEGRFDPKKSCLAQAEDVAALAEKCKEFPDYKKFVFGLSRGAATTLNNAALNGTDDVLALIVESPFAHVKDVVSQVMSHAFGSAAKSRILATCGHFFVPFVYRHYKRNGIQPIDLVENIRKDLPVLFICSQEDSLIPWTSTMKLYFRMLLAGHKHVYALVLKRGRHGRILIGPEGRTYQQVFHAFSKRYGLPYNEGFASEGAELLDKCQLPLDYVREWPELDYDMWLAQDEDIPGHKYSSFKVYCEHRDKKSSPQL